MILFLIPSALADCSEWFSNADLSADLTRAEDAFVAMDTEGFTAARDEANRDLECLREPITPRNAATFHRMKALDAFVAEDRAGTVSAFQASLTADPSWQIPDSIAPVGHPLREQWEIARALPPAPAEALERPGGLTYKVNGGPPQRVPGQPLVLQALDEDGAVVGSAWVPANGPLPAWGAEEAPQPVKEERGGAPIGLLIGAGLSAGAAGGLYLVAAAAEGDFEDPATPYEDLEALQTRANRSSLGAAIALGATVGLGVAVGVAW